MPFDRTIFRQPTVTVLPPQEPPERGDRPPRIRIGIAIVHRRRPQQRPRRGYRFGTLTLALLVIVLLAALAGCTAPAHPSPWESYREGFVIMHGADAAGGQQWNDTSYRSGVTTYDANGPHTTPAVISAPAKP